MSYFGTYGETQAQKDLRANAAAALDELDTTTVPATIKGISYNIDVGASGAEVTTLQEALVFLGYLSASDASGKYDAKTGVAVKNFIEATSGLTCAIKSGNYTARGCKRVDQAVAQAIDAAVGAKGATITTSVEGILGLVGMGTGGAPAAEGTCTEKLPWWQGLAIGAGIAGNPCPPLGQATGTTLTDQEAIAAAACTKFKDAKGSKIAISGAVAGLSGALMGLAFAEEKAKGAAIGAVALGILGAGLFALFEPGKPDGCI